MDDGRPSSLSLSPSPQPHGVPPPPLHPPIPGLLGPAGAGAGPAPDSSGIGLNLDLGPGPAAAGAGPPAPAGGGAGQGPAGVWNNEGTEWIPAGGWNVDGSAWFPEGVRNVDGSEWIPSDKLLKNDASYLLKRVQSRVHPDPDPKKWSRTIPLDHPSLGTPLREFLKSRKMSGPESPYASSIDDALDKINTSSEHYANGKPHTKIDAASIKTILTTRLIPPELRSPFALNSLGMATHPEHWIGDFAAYIVNDSGKTLRVFKRSHIGGQTFAVYTFADFSLDPSGRLFCYVYPAGPGIQMGGRRRRRRTRRITKASRYPRSGTRSRSRR